MDDSAAENRTPDNYGMDDNAAKTRIPDNYGLTEFSNAASEVRNMLKNTYVCLSKGVKELEEEVSILKTSADAVETSDAFSKELSEKLFKSVVKAARCDKVHEEIEMRVKKNSENFFKRIMEAQCDELHEGIKKLEHTLGDLKAFKNIIKQKEERSLIMAMKIKGVEWYVKGHGQYLNITKENEFFSAKDQNDYFVIHCSSESSVHCKGVDMHLSALAAEHLATKFVKFDVEKIPSLSNHLNVHVTPTVFCFIKSKGVDVIVDHNELGVGDELSAGRLKKRLANSGVINYDLFSSLEI